MSDPRDPRTLLDAATEQLLATVDGLPEAALAEPSGLPDWSRGHVVAHLVLNGEALAAALAGVAAGMDVPMYASQDARDGDIDDLATHPPAELRTRLHTAVRGFAGALALVPPDAWGTTIRRTPAGDKTFTAGDTISMRLTETEIHHADLAAGYSCADWSPEFSAHLVARRVRQHAPVRLVATDTGEEWMAGDGGPVVSGSVADLGWWLTGRGGVDRLTAEGGPLPTIGNW
ncbi:maleylpyruvate isomerase family mycothiol-dependent enzyme [Nocardioides sp. KR10-350]|uniref:maleylpyruvate isomerase family mycothiol-dependent enzyme n=1 Tax=Nocardioides cheoyonin TaxID=3156615 RepID=UPI0032B3E066